jgi:hypothetical protein
MIEDAKLRAQRKNESDASAKEREIEGSGTASADHPGGGQEWNPPQIPNPFNEILVITLGEGACEDRKYLDA